MAQADLLSQLKDVHLPESVSWWPLAIGWWVIIGLFFLSIALLTIRFIKKQRQHKFAKFAILELDDLTDKDVDNWLIQLQLILRRVSLCYFPKKNIANLNQQQWINFLLQTGEKIWSEKPLILLRDSTYQNPSSIDPLHKQLLFKQARSWIKTLPEVKNV